MSTPSENPGQLACCENKYTMFQPGIVWTRIEKNDPPTWDKSPKKVLHPKSTTNKWTQSFQTQIKHFTENSIRGPGSWRQTYLQFTWENSRQFGPLPRWGSSFPLFAPVLTPCYLPYPPTILTILKLQSLNSETETNSRDQIIWELVFSVIQGLKFHLCRI